VMFITTANILHGIPFPLLDRMEVIEVPGYSEYEKLEIAKKFIVPKQIEENGLSGAGLKFRDAAILEIVRHYTMESGVRSLEREIARVVRKLAKEAVEKGCADDPTKLGDWSPLVTEKRVAALLGKRRREGDVVFGDPKPGVAYGLAWTEAGGTLLPVESAVFEGSEGLILTGNLGDVMKESARAALTYLRSRAADYGLSEADFRKKSVHIHVPEGAIPKDGPSAGITMATSILSAVTNIPCRKDLAMTGEITLRGKVLPVGGIKEKLLAAYRAGITTIVLPRENEKDLDDIPEEIRNVLETHLVDDVDEVVRLALETIPVATAPKAVPAATETAPPSNLAH